MTEEGCTCDDPDLVPVKDMSMTLPFISGNPYSRFCRTCGRRYFCAKKFWKRAKQKFVIPDGDERPVTVEEYDENFFECPECGEPHFGYPDDCDCGAEYAWDGVED